MDNLNSEDNVTCSFCGKPRIEVGLLIANPNGVTICDECVFLSIQIMIGQHRNVRKANSELRKSLAEKNAIIAGYEQHGIAPEKLAQMEQRIKEEVMGKIVDVLAKEESVTTSAGSEEEHTDDQEADSTGRGNEGTPA